MLELFELVKNGFIFGLIDNIIVVGAILIAALVAMYACPCPVKRAARWDWSVMSAIVGSLANALSDFLGAIGDPTMWSSITGITAGCLSVTLMLVVPKYCLCPARQ